jgi:chemotaxis protein CheX
MKMELIQPFINSADAVLAESLRGTITVSSLSMLEEAYRRRGPAAVVLVTGDIEGRIIFDLDTDTAVRVATRLNDTELGVSGELVQETIKEIANLIIGNAVTSLNDQGFHFHVHPPETHTAETGASGNEDTEALVMCFDTASGAIYMNIALHYGSRMVEEASASV